VVSALPGLGVYRAPSATIAFSGAAHHAAVDITADLIRSAWLWPANLLYGAILLAALRRVPWRWLRNPADLNIWLAVCSTLVLGVGQAVVSPAAI
jgi:hypothetical protein